MDIEERVMPDMSVPVVKKDINKYAKAGAVMCMNQHNDCIQALAKGKIIISKDNMHELKLSDEKGGLGIIAVVSPNAISMKLWR